MQVKKNVFKKPEQSLQSSDSSRAGVFNLPKMIADQRHGCRYGILVCSVIWCHSMTHIWASMGVWSKVWHIGSHVFGLQ